MDKLRGAVIQLALVKAFFFFFEWEKAMNTMDMSSSTIAKTQRTCIRLTWLRQPSLYQDCFTHKTRSIEKKIKYPASFFFCCLFHS